MVFVELYPRPRRSVIIQIRFMRVRRKICLQRVYTNFKNMFYFLALSLMVCIEKVFLCASSVRKKMKEMKKGEKQKSGSCCSQWRARVSSRQVVGVVKQSPPPHAPRFVQHTLEEDRSYRGR